MAAAAPQLTADAAIATAIGLYGRWNALLADTPDGSQRWTPAHDGDFFPESPLDYVEVLRKAVVSNRPVGGVPLTPVRVDIDVTQVCNARCTFCFSRPYQDKRYRGARIHAVQLANTLADLRALGTRTVRFCGGGEPFAHPDIDDLLPLPRRHGLGFCVITSLDLVDENRAAAILDHVDHLRWSVNAGSDRTRVALHRPVRGANALSVSLSRVERMIARRAANRRPLVWATYLVVPENVGEIVACAARLKSAGVDSVSFRPVYHGLHGGWDARSREVLLDALAAVRRLDDAPNFCVFTPRRNPSESLSQVPSEHFSVCLSRMMRTVLEPTVAGPALQSCGTYRGSGALPTQRLAADEHFDSAWSRFQLAPTPAQAPQGCAECIDISINRTLAFMLAVLQEDPCTRFRRAQWRDAVSIPCAVE